jgi:hypothetical protein
MSRGLGRIQRLILQVMKERADAEHGRRSPWSVEDIARAVLYQLKPNAVWRGSRAAADLRAAAATRWEVKRAIPRLVADGRLLPYEWAPLMLPASRAPRWKLAPETEIERQERLESQRRKRAEREAKKKRTQREDKGRQRRHGRQERKHEQVREKQRETLTRILGMLGSDNANERAIAARKAEKMRRDLGLSWDDIVTRFLPHGR